MVFKPRPRCKECGKIVPIGKEIPLDFFKHIPPWVFVPDELYGIYCCSDHLLDAYERGIPLSRLGLPPPPRRR